LAIAGIAILFGALKLGLTTHTTPSTIQQSTSAPAAQAGTGATGVGSSGTSGPAPHAKIHRWEKGLASLRRQMTHAMPAGTITPGSLLQTATTLRRCAPELDALGPPARPLRSTYRLARWACAAFAQGAGFAVAAARAYTATTRSGKMTKLLNQLDAAFNHGINLISIASYGASIFSSGG